MLAPKTKKNETRSAYIARATLALYGAGETLPATRRAIAARLGEDPSGNGLLGTVDPIYYRAKGRANPIAVAGKTPKTRAASLLRAVRARRDSGERWEVLAGAIETGTGRERVSKDEAKRLYSDAGGDLAASYAGRGTRVGAPKTYGAPTAPVVAAATNPGEKKTSARDGRGGSLAPKTGAKK